MSIAIERETCTEALQQELLPLAQKCWDEGSANKGEHCAFHGKRDVQIEPDFDLYQMISDKGRLIIFTIRDEAKLVGYAIAMLYPSPHHCKLLTANGDSIYVEPPYRVHSPVLLEKVINQVREAGAVTLNWGVSPQTPMYDLLAKFGFVGDEVIMEKLLCVS